MTGFDPLIYVAGSNRSTNWDTTTALNNTCIEVHLPNFIFFIS